MSGLRYEVGIDEVGRGPIAGPLCVGAALVRKRQRRALLASLQGLRECKQLSSRERGQWCARLRTLHARGTLTIVTTFISHGVIDKRGMAAALRLGVRRCLTKLSVIPEEADVLLDGGLRAPEQYPFQKTIVDGDETEPLIAAASIVAKVRRDRYMVRLSRRYPRYGFEEHKGYGTRKHFEALRRHGLSSVHRRSFLKSLIQNP